MLSFPNLVTFQYRSAWARFFRPGLGRTKDKNFVPIRKGSDTFGPSPEKNTISWPGLCRIIFFSNFGPDCLGLSDFKINLFNYYHTANINDAFFFFWPSTLENLFLFYQPSPARLVGKINSRLPIHWEKSQLICRRCPACLKKIIF